MSLKLSASQIARLAWTIRAEYLGSLETVVVPEDWNKLKVSQRRGFTQKVKAYLEREELGSSRDYYDAVFGLPCIGHGWGIETESERHSYLLANDLIRNIKAWYDPSK
jgi:hypothetical protein